MTATDNPITKQHEVVGFIRDFCEEILDIAYLRAEDVLTFNDAIKVRDIGYKIVEVAEQALEGGTPDDTLLDAFDRVTRACREKINGVDVDEIDRLCAALERGDDDDA